jgi:hypothetical protein
VLCHFQESALGMQRRIRGCDCQNGRCYRTVRGIRSHAMLKLYLGTELSNSDSHSIAGEIPGGTQQDGAWHEVLRGRGM